MCLTAVTTVFGVVVNCAVGVWILSSFPNEQKPLSAIFLLPAAAALPMMCARRESPIRRTAGLLLVISGTLKAGIATVLALSASNARNDRNPVVKVLGTGVYSALSLVSAAAGLTDLVSGLAALCARGRERPLMNIGEARSDSVEVV